jgi:hypothetical protein
MELASALKNEIFRPLITIVVPGAFAIGPYVLLVGHYVPVTRGFMNANSYMFGIVISVMILAMGLILEDVGTRIEIGCDRFLGKDKRCLEGKWKQYLQLKTQDEFIAQRFLRTIHVRFKFELSMAPALLIFTVGLIWLNCIYRFFHASAMAWIALILFGLIVYLLKEAYDSNDHMRDLHEYIIEAVQNEENKGSTPSA